MSTPFEGPREIAARLFSLSATAGGGGGGRLSAAEGGRSTLLQEAKPGYAGDAASQVAQMVAPDGGIPTGAGTAAEREDDKALDAAEGSSSHPSLAARLASGLGSIVASSKAALAGVESGMASGGQPILTSQFGCPFSDPTHSLKIGGHPLVSDLILMEKQQMFNRQKTVERAVHACGSGALGYFTVTNDVSKYTKAAFLSSVGKVTPLVCRFSTTTYGREFPDEARNPRGLAFKFKTEEGDYDILSINFPTFFTRDGITGPDVIRSQQRNPANFQINFDATFDLMALLPESALANLWYWSDHGTPHGWMYMDGYPAHTFKWVNAAGEVHYVKYKLVSMQGVKNFTQAEAIQISGVDPDFSKRETFEHIANGGKAEWMVTVQIVPESELKNLPVDPFDSSKVWPEAQYPRMEVGRITLDKNVENYHRDTEQVAFSPGRLVPGIEPTPDPLLQFRLWLYQDAQIHRLGANYMQIPVNCPFMSRQYHPMTRDGAMRVDANGGHEPPYFPNSYPRAGAMSSGTSAPGVYAAVPNPHAGWKPAPIVGAVAERGMNSTHEGKLDDDYVQARDFWRDGLNDQDKANLYSNIAFALRSVTRREVRLRFLLSCYRVHEDYAAGVCSALIQVCQAHKADPMVSWNELKALAEKLKDTPLVDVNNAYKPVDLGISV